MSWFDFVTGSGLLVGGGLMAVSGIRFLFGGQMMGVITGVLGLSLMYLGNTVIRSKGKGEGNG